MIFPEIKKLYKYTSINENSIGILVKDQFWFSKPDKFNDPLDCGIRLLNNATKLSVITDFENDLKQLNEILRINPKNSKTKELIANVEENIEYFKTLNDDSIEFREGIGDRLNNLITEEIQESGILSLSEINDNILMWSHYADQHKGICIELERNNSNILANNTFTLPVRYSIKKPKITLYEQQIADQDERKEIKRSLIFTKSIDWSYEREWRVVKSTGDQAYKLNSKITAIIFGLKTPKHTIETIIQLLRRTKSDIELKQARLKSDDFGIEIVDYQDSSNISPQSKISEKKPIRTTRTTSPVLATTP